MFLIIKANVMTQARPRPCVHLLYGGGCVGRGGGPPADLGHPLPLPRGGVGAAPPHRSGHMSVSLEFVNFNIYVTLLFLHNTLDWCILQVVFKATGFKNLCRKLLVKVLHTSILNFNVETTSLKA